MTAGVEGLPTGARDRLAEAVPDELGPVGLAHRPIPQLGVAREVSGYGNQLLDALLPVVAKLCDEARADELCAQAEALHVQRFNADEEPDNRWPPGARREVPSFYRGVVMAENQLKARARELSAEPEPTCQLPYTEGHTTWRCLRPAGHGDQVRHEDSAGHRW